MKRYQLASVASPSIEFECGGHVVHSTVIKNTQKNPNFDQPLFFFDVVSGCLVSSLTMLCSSHEMRLLSSRHLENFHSGDVDYKLT